MPVRIPKVRGCHPRTELINVYGELDGHGIAIPSRQNSQEGAPRAMEPKTYCVVTEDGQKIEYQGYGLSDAVDAYYYDTRLNDDAPLAVGVYLAGNTFAGYLA